MKFLKRYWIPVLLFALFSIFTITDHTIMKRKMEEVKQENLKERIEYSLDWSRMLCDKQGLIIDQLYRRRIISAATQRALQKRNEIWLKQQTRRRNKKWTKKKD